MSPCLNNDGVAGRYVSCGWLKVNILAAFDLQSSSQVSKIV